MNKRKLWWLMIFFTFPLITFGQEKSISKEKVSVKIQEYVKTNYPEVTKIKYYQEMEGDTIFVEGEFKYKNDKYSLKFYKDQLVEVEVFLLFREIPVEVQLKIKETLDGLNSHYKIIECQEVNPTTNAIYEILVESRVPNTSGNFEFYFDKSGNFIEKNEMSSKPIPSQF